MRLPLSVTHTTNVNMTEAFPHSYLTLATNFSNYNMLGPGSYGNPAPVCTKNSANPPKIVCVTNPAGNLSHPTQGQLTWTSFQNHVIGKLPLYEQIYFGYGFSTTTRSARISTQRSPHQGQSGLQAFGGQCIYNVTTGPVPCPTTYTSIYNECRRL